MRNTFSDYLFKEAERDPNIYIVVADISQLEVWKTDLNIQIDL